MRRGWIDRPCVVVLFSLLCMASLAQAASAVDYWPHAVGTTWVYVDEFGNRQTTRVVESDRTHAEPMIVIESRESFWGARTLRSYYVIRDGQVLQVAVGHPRFFAQGAPEMLPSPTVVYPATLDVGTHWRSHPEDASSPETFVAGRGRIQLHDGSYEALVIGDRAGTRATTRWIVPGVGVVRMAVMEVGQPKPVRLMELERFGAPSAVPPSGG